ncbi:MAG: MarR family transcriptional regulator [bacterium]|nr:MarR family transcriptional regulator [bacterium]
MGTGDSDYSLGFLLTKSARLVQKRYEERLQRFGITPQQSGILAIIGSANGISPADIVPMMHSDKATISSMLSRLEKQDLIEFQKSPTDGRARILRLTKAGRKLLPEVQRIDKAISDELAEKLSASDSRAVKKFLLALYRSS